MEQNWICERCQVALETDTVRFAYLEHTFEAELPRCPKCQQVYIDEPLVRGKMQDVETEVEDK
jgi:Zn-finger nucleic acid-binding protein